MRILVVEDDKDVGAFVVRGLKEAGHVVELADNGRDGLFMAASETFDAVILDRMLPGGIDGLKILETLRSQKNTVPVLILSALAVDERVRGLKAGGDDYLTKPFAFAELLARVEALARRGKGEGPAPSWWSRNWSSICCRARCAPARRSTCSRANSGCWNI